MEQGYSSRIVKAIHVLRDRFMEPVRVEDLAATAQMSASAFHRHFKALTLMTPLQYQKQLRLLEARRNHGVGGGQGGDGRVRRRL